MDNIEAFQEIKKDFEKLGYKDSDELDRLSRRLRMRIKNVLTESSYIRDFNNIHFSPIAVFSGMPESSFIESWNNGTNSTINLIDTIIEELRYFPKDTRTKAVSQKSEIFDSSKVFIVHGHDDGAVDKVARFVQRLGFEAIVLHEQSSSGDTIIEKVIRYSDVGFGIVLYTECDVGAVKSEPENLRLRARQNVVFEHGFLIGKIGRKNVVALVKGDVEKPNDISGVVYESMDISGAWMYSIAREMKISGYDVDTNKLIN